MGRSASQSNDQTENDQSYDDQDFDARKPEFEFSKNPYSKIVDDDDENEKNRYPNCWIYFLSRHPVP